MGENSTLKVMVLKDGMSAQTLSGQVRHVLSDVKNKVGYYRAGNGYTWAHAEGTNFVVAANSKSKSVNIQTDEGRIIITDEVPVQIGQTAKTKGGVRGARELKTVVRTENGAGQRYTTQAQTQPKKFNTYAEAIAEFEAETNKLEKSGQGYDEELADKFALIGELYMDIGEYDRAQEPLYKAMGYTAALDSEDLYILDVMLYLAEACIYGTDAKIQEAGVKMVREFIGEGEGILNEYLVDYKYANDQGDADWAWDLCYDLVDLNEYLGWAHDLLNQKDKAAYYYKEADHYDSLL
jgi:tetratricopeptide (TPR) repeat protein